MSYNLFVFNGFYLFIFQIVVNSLETVAEAVQPILQEFGLRLNDASDNRLVAVKDKKSKKTSKLPSIKIEDAKDDSSNIYNANFAIALLGGSRAPVDQNASAALLDGELLILQMQAPPFDGKDLAVFLLSEREYGE